VMRFTLRSLLAFPASSRISAVRYYRTAAAYTAAVAPTRPFAWLLSFFSRRWMRPTGNCKEVSYNIIRFSQGVKLSSKHPFCAACNIQPEQIKHQENSNQIVRATMYFPSSRELGHKVHCSHKHNILGVATYKPSSQ
jgi:hypothetical protein